MPPINTAANWKPIPLMGIIIMGTITEPGTGWILSMTAVRSIDDNHQENVLTGRKPVQGHDSWLIILVQRATELFIVEMQQEVVRMQCNCQLIRKYSTDKRQTSRAMWMRVQNANECWGSA
jgi:hypothetical protein